MKMLYGRNATNVDWRKLLVCVAQPWPIPTAQQLVRAWTVLTNGDEEVMGVVMISKEKFMSTEIWLDHPFEESEEGKDPQQKPKANDASGIGASFNRIPALKEVNRGRIDFTLCSCYLCKANNRT